MLPRHIIWYNKSNDSRFGYLRKRPSWAQRIIPWVIVAFVFCADAVVKFQATIHLSHAQGMASSSVTIIPKVFSLHYCRNYGMAFSMFANATIIITILTGVLLAALLVVLAWKVREFRYSIPLAMVLGGGIGNLVERIVHGYVTDMFNLSHFAVFNVADIFICVGCVLLCIAAIVPEKTKKTYR